MAQDKKYLRNYFNLNSPSWGDRAYDFKNERTRYPSAKTRHAITLQEVISRKKKGAILDMGCGGGELVVDLLRLGYQTQGFDLSEGMIKQAKKNLAKEKKISASSKKNVFQVSDLDGYNNQDKFDFITAMGFVTYLDADKEFFNQTNKLIKKGGYIIVDFRNKLFNLFSGNDYTAKIMKDKAAAKMLKELDQIEKYSPQNISHLPQMEIQINRTINRELKKNKNIKDLAKPNKFKRITKKIILRQHTPKEVEKIAHKFGYQLESIIYYHAHPFLPKYEKDFPVLFNTLSLAMQPLGNTVIGASICSSFVAVIRKK